jgi:O-antigen/teichoic acid export membrane protein
MMGFFLVTLALNQSDLYFLEALGDEVEVGQYGAAAMVAHFLILIQTGVVGHFASGVRPAIERGPDASRAFFRQALKLMLGLLVPVAVALMAAAHPVLALFGPDYESAHAVLVLLVIGNFAWATSALAGLWLQYRGQAHRVLVISLAVLAADSLLNLLLIPRFGMTGAAAGTACTLSVAAVATISMLRRRSSSAAS